MSEVSTDKRAIEGVASGVPFLAIPPENGAKPDSATVVAWHLLDAPRTPAAFAAALPLAGLDVWRVYLGLPMSGSRKPAGGDEELLRLGYEDGVLNIQGPITDQAAGEFGPAFSEIAGQLGLGSGPVGLLGGSAGAAVALLVLAEQDIDVSAAVLVSPLVRLRSLVETMERHFGVEYDWSDRSREVAARLDFVERAGEIADRRQDPAVLLVVGEDDDVDGIRRPARGTARHSRRPVRRAHTCAASSSSPEWVIHWRIRPAMTRRRRLVLLPRSIVLLSTGSGGISGAIELRAGAYLSQRRFDPTIPWVAVTGQYPLRLDVLPFSERSKSLGHVDRERCRLRPAGTGENVASRHRITDEECIDRSGMDGDAPRAVSGCVDDAGIPGQVERCPVADRCHLPDVGGAQSTAAPGSTRGTHREARPSSGPTKGSSSLPRRLPVGHRPRAQ